MDFAASTGRRELRRRADEEQHVWLFRFDSEEERACLYRAVYQNDYWRGTLSPRVGELIHRGQAQTATSGRRPRR